MPGGETMLAATSFGGFSIEAPDPENPGSVRRTFIDNKGSSLKTRLLVEYLIFSGRESVQFEELIELIWPDEGPGNPLASLRLLVHRVRGELDRLGVFSGAEMILLKDKAYCWNWRIPLRRDAELFDQLYSKSRRGSAEDRLAALLEAADIYRGRFLPGSMQRQWVMVLDTYYHSKYISMCEEAIGILEDLGRTWDIIELCKKAVAIDPYAETLHIAFIKALTDAGSYGAALDHYKHVNALFLDEFGITPSDSLKAVYGALVKSINIFEADIGVIRRSLTDTAGGGALFIEFEVFKQIYQLKSRESARSGQPVQLALISVSPAAGKTPGERSRRTCMERLSEVIRGSLRQGDLYTRYSVLQYLLLLSADGGNGQKILERIQRGFKSSCPRSGYLLQCSIVPLLPKSPPDGESRSEGD